jgi:hypothetical protein
MNSVQFDSLLLVKTIFGRLYALAGSSSCSHLLQIVGGTVKRLFGFLVLMSRLRSLWGSISTG